MFPFCYVQLNESGSVFVFSARILMLDSSSNGNLFLLCLSKKSETPRYSLFMLVLCCQGFVGSPGVSFSTHASSNQAFFFGKAKNICMRHKFIQK